MVTILDKFQMIKNNIIGRLSLCQDKESLAGGLQRELDRLKVPAGNDIVNKAMLIGADISDGIDRANAVLEGKIDDL